MAALKWNGWQQQNNFVSSAIAQPQQPQPIDIKIDSDFSAIQGFP